VSINANWLIMIAWKRAGMRRSAFQLEMAALLAPVSFITPLFPPSVRTTSVTELILCMGMVYVSIS
jgi:hypothetical protein